MLPEYWKFTGTGLVLNNADRTLFSCAFLTSRKRGPTAFVRFLNLRKQKPAGVARGFLKIRKRGPTKLGAQVFL